MKKNLIVFDIDGTLTDSAEIHKQAFTESLHEVGVKEVPQNFRAFRHHTDSFIAKDIVERETGATFSSEMQQRFEELLYEKIIQQSIQEIPGAQQLVTNIENHEEWEACFATGSLYRPAEYKLQSIGITSHSLQTVASDKFHKRESIVQQAITNAQEFHNVEEFARIIAFGDGIWDLKTAEVLGLEFIGVGETHKKRLQDHGCTFHVNDFRTITVEEL
jgi:phosphoglycolate phosphatase-like HAD superfamily hydrolase